MDKNYATSEMISLTPTSTEASSELAIEGEDLIFRYGRENKNNILNEVNIHVKKGSIYGLLGPSGCGKTTLLKCISGKLKAHSGNIRIYGRQPGDESLCIPGRGIGYMPQELALYMDLTVEESLMYFGSLYSMKKKKLEQKISFLMKFLSIKYKNRLVRNLSGGEQRRVSFASALIHEPPLLILDEPTVGIDPLLRRSIWNHLKDMVTKQHITIVITTHYVEEARKANTVGFMRCGHLLAETNPEIIIRHFAVGTLEEVFWQLCQNEDTVSKDESNLCPVIKSGDKLNFDKSSEEGWITHKKFNGIDCNVNDPENKICSSKLNSSWENNSDINPEIIYPKLPILLKFAQSLLRMMALMNKSFICLRRNTVYALFQLFVPAVQVIIFCLSIGQEPFDLSLAIASNETSIFGKGDMFFNTLSNKTFNKVYHESVDSAINAVKNGDSWASIVIGPRFSSALLDRVLEGSNADNQTVQDGLVHLYMDMSNNQIAFTIYARIFEAFQAFGKELLIHSYQSPYLAEPPIEVHDPIYGSKTSNFMQFLAPGSMLGMVHILAIGLSLLTVIAEKNNGLMERCWMAGISTAEMVIGVLSVLFFTMLGQVTLVIVLTLLFFDVPLLGSTFWVFMCLVLAGTSGMSYGLLLAAICDKEVVGVMITVATFYPCFLLSGLLWPVEGMDYYVRYISYCLPLTFLGESIRSLMLRGWTITQKNIWVGPLIGVGWTIVLTVIAGMIFKFRRTRG